MIWFVSTEGCADVKTFIETSNMIGFDSVEFCADVKTFMETFDMNGFDSAEDCGAVLGPAINQAWSPRVF